MKFHQSILLLIAVSFLACNTATTQTSSIENSDSNKDNQQIKELKENRHYRGAITGGMKGDSIFFDVTNNGTRLENLTFKGYWRCNGKLEMLRAAGPDGFFTLVNNKVDDHISEPPNGGSTAWRFNLSATIKGNTASGTFSMNINNLGCNTGKLQWTAVAL